MTDYANLGHELFEGQKPRHVLSLSGGKDSAALAIYMRDRVPDMEYIFHDTDKELPETYDFLARLEAILGKPIVKTSPTDTFDHWLSVYGGMLPSNHRRWCTRMLKLKPFENYIGDGPVINYVGLRADENRTGYISTKPNIKAVYPFQEDGLVRADIIRIRSKTRCSPCFAPKQGRRAPSSSPAPPGTARAISAGGSGKCSAARARNGPPTKSIFN